MSAARLGTRKPKPRARAVTPPKAASTLRPEVFFPAIDAATKEELFAAMVEALARIGVAQHRGALCDALLERERLGTTALGFGVAVPHARSMVVAETVVGFARLRRGIDFAAPDGQPVNLVFLIVGPYGASGTAYLPVLAAIAGTVQDEASRARLLELETFEELDRLLRFPLAAKETER